MKPYQLSNELVATQMHNGGVALAQCRRVLKQDTVEIESGMILAILTDEELTRLIAWWYEQRQVEAGPADDLVVLIVELAANRQIQKSTAVIALRALMDKAAAAALESWTASDSDSEQEEE